MGDNEFEYLSRQIREQLNICFSHWISQLRSHVTVNHQNAAKCQHTYAALPRAMHSWVIKW